LNIDYLPSNTGLVHGLGPRSRPLHSIIPAPHPDIETVVHDSDRQFKIRSADCAGKRSSASVLVERMYASRGYRSVRPSTEASPSRVTLTAVEHEETIGTITIGFDSHVGLLVDELFFDEASALRDAGRRICEFTKLAMDSVVQSKRVLASMFHVAYMHAHRLMGLDDLLIEVNPRHVRYYARMLGFEVCGDRKHNPRVDAPAVLMRLRFERARREIERLAGSPELATSERSLYPFFFSRHEEAAILARLQRRQGQLLAA